MLVADCEHRLLERTPLYLGEESRQFLLGCQMKPLDLRCGSGPAPAAARMACGVQDRPGHRRPQLSGAGSRGGLYGEAASFVCGPGTVAVKMAKANRCKA